MDPFEYYKTGKIRTDCHSLPSFSHFLNIFIPESGEYVYRGGILKLFFNTRLSYVLGK